MLARVAQIYRVLQVYSRRASACYVTIIHTPATEVRWGESMYYFLRSRTHTTMALNVGGVNGARIPLQCGLSAIHS